MLSVDVFLMTFDIFVFLNDLFFFKGQNSEKKYVPTVSRPTSGGRWWGSYGSIIWYHMVLYGTIWKHTVPLPPAQGEKKIEGVKKK